MSGGAVAVWIRIAGGSALALVLLVALDPPRPARVLPASEAAVVASGVAAGAGLFVSLARRRPRLPPRPVSLPIAVAKHGVLGLLAADEEIVWRRVVLGETLAAGVVAALAVSTIGFATIHRARRGTHIATGSSLGGLYLASGSLLTTVIAHWTYNALLSASLERVRAAGVPP